MKIVKPIFLTLLFFTIIGCSQDNKLTGDLDNNDIENNPVIEKVPTFLHGTWYRVIYSYDDVGQGLRTNRKNCY
jgi:hypothetical protein